MTIPLSRISFGGAVHTVPGRKVEAPCEMMSSTKITSLSVRDVRFPTSLTGDGSDAIASRTLIRHLRVNNYICRKRHRACPITRKWVIAAIRYVKVSLSR